MTPPYAALAVASLALIGCANIGQPHEFAALAPRARAATGSAKIASPWSVAAELQAYPTGVIGSVTGGRRLSARDVLTMRAGYNLADRDDNGDSAHAEEEGGGPGLGVGYHHYFAHPGEDGWFVGARLDLWWLEIDWEEKLFSGSSGAPLPAGPTGTTDVFVVQPTFEGGYGWHLATGHRFELTAGLGAEINASTDGQDVGEGAILLLGVRYWFGR